MLRFIRSTTLEQAGGPAGAAAGIAITQVHTPFSRAYALAEHLCRNAKTKVAIESPHQPGWALDWLYDPNAASTDDARDAHRTCRPYVLTPPGRDPVWPDWDWLVDSVLTSSDHHPSALFGPYWATRRSALHALLIAAEQGPAEVERVLTERRLMNSASTPSWLPLVWGRPNEGLTGDIEDLFDLWNPLAAAEVTT